MMDFCPKCKKKMNYSIRERFEEDTIDGICFSMKQKYAFCDLCGSEMLPKEIIDENTRTAHDAYREARGSITVSEIKQILEIYNIGPKPLSQLLGWGENTIERQMKHTIPDIERSNILKGLFNPAEMIRLLVLNSDRISSVALRKALTAAINSLAKMISSEEMQQRNVISFQSNERQYISAETISVEQLEEEKERKASSYVFISQPNAFISSPFDHPYAA